MRMSDGSSDVCSSDLAAAGAAAAKKAGFAAEPGSYAVEGDIASAGVSSRELPSDSDAARAKAFVDFQNDVTAKDIRLAVREGFRSIEHIKRYTTTGMATDQGKTSNMNGLSIARSEEHTSELQSLMRISYAVFCLKKKKKHDKKKETLT